MKIHTSLRLNSAFSSISGIMIIAFSESLGQLMNYNNDLLYKIIGFGLLFFGLSLALISLLKEIRKPLVKLIILMDFTWVSGSLILLILPTPISVEGKILLTTLALMVLFIALLQRRSLKELA